MKRQKIICECLGGEKHCGKIDIRDTGDNTCEINWYEGKKCVTGVLIGENQIKKIIEFLEKVIK